MKAAALLAALLLSGCAGMEPYWKRSYEPLGREKIIMRANENELRADYARIYPRQPLPRDSVLSGFVDRHVDANLCEIYMRADDSLPSCTLAHERAHCKGWMHPSNMALAFDCGPDEKEPKP